MKKNYLTSALNKYNTLLLLVFAFFFTNALFAQFPGNDNAPGIGKTFNVPTGVTSVTASAWGAGGGGGGSSSNNNGGNGGGGGGATTRVITVTGGSTSFTYTVGGGGNAGAAAAGAGGNGGLSSITSAAPSTNMIANGGTGGLGNNVALGTPTNSGGGTASGGTTNPSGANGFSNAGNGGNSGSVIGIFGTGGLGRTNNSGLSGSTPGAGGGGGERDNGGGGTNYAGGAGANGQVSFHYIGVTNITSPACIGSTITITGFNFAAGATTVTINGTICTSVIVVNTTTITAVVAAGTTSGTVVITNPNGTNNGIGITVNALPANPGNPTSNSPQCNPPGVTLTRAGTPPVGETWYWQTTALGTSTTNSGATFIVTTSGTYYLRAQNNTTGCWSAGSGSLAVIVNTSPTITANPANSSIAVGTNTSFSVTASGAPTSYIWEVSTDGGLGWSSVTNTGVYSNATTATLDITAAPLSMSGYMYRARAINTCGASANSTTATLTVSLVYCTPSSTGNTYPISNVTFAGINNNSSATVSAGPFYQDFTAISGSVIPNGTYTFSATATGLSPNPFGIYVFFDWNNNGDLTDDGGPTTIGTYTTTASGVLSASISIPATAVVGSTVRMRVANQFNSVPSPCPTGGTFQDEDYTINIIAGPACSTPAAQPTALVLTPGGTFINGSFTAAAGADRYLVVINTTNVAPTLANGTSYAIGDNLGGTNVVVDIDNNTTFTAGQLNLSTTYYVYVFSYNSACTGGPMYRTLAPLNGPGTTTASPPTYCTPVTTSTPINRLYVSNVEFVGTLLDTSNASTTDGVADGYQDFTGLATKSSQAQAGPINIKLNSNNVRGFWKVWVDWNKDGDFSDSGEEVYNPGGYLFDSTTFGFIVPANATPGNYRMRVRVQNTLDDNFPVNDPNYESLLYFDSCNSFNTISANKKTYGEAEDYLFTVIAKCDNKITSISNPAICGPGTATLSAIGTGTDVKWYDSLTGGILAGTTANGANFTPVIAATTTYYITSWSAGCETLTRIPVIAEVKPVPALNIATPNVTICGENNIIQLDATGNNEIAFLINESFEGGLGVFSNVNSDGTTAAQKGQTAWKSKTSIFVPNGGRWFPAISSGFGANKFVLTSMDDFKTVPLPTVPMENSLTLTTGVNPNATAFTNLTLSLRMFYSRYIDDGASTTLENCKVEVSTNGGGSWPVTLATITADQGYGSNFVTLTYDLTAYRTSTDLKIRIKVLGNGTAGGTSGDGVAIDDIKLYGSRPLTPYFALGGGVDSFTNAAATIPYTGDQRNTIWIKPTLTQLEQAAFTINVNANLNNGCTTTGSINVTNNSKVWKGGGTNSWNVAGNWAPAGIPTATTCVIIPTGTTSNILNAPDALARNVVVKAPTGNLDLQTTRNLTVTDWINVETGATFNVRNSANLVQINDAAVNTGSINMNRIATGLHAKDYIYWSTPVENFGIANVSPLTSASRIYHWVPDSFNGAGYGYGNWFNINENMTAGKGYIVRVPNSNPTFSTTFTGRPQNGVVTRTITRGPYTGVDYVGTNGVTITNEDDNWNLVGNPYPSAIDAVEFLTANSASIAGQVNLWTHTTPISISSSPYYQAFVYNYRSNDYVTYNSAGSNIGPTVGFNGKIGAGQAFFVKRIDGAAGSGTITFNNSMRNDATNTPYNNGQFYKASGDETTPVEPEKNRIWLDLIDSNLNTSRVMFGYMDGATNEKDHMYDATTNYTESLKAFTTIGNNEEIYVIQGKGLPFDATDKIGYGIQVPVTGTYSIAISDVDGLFKTEGQKIYIEDLLTNVTQDLTTSPYSFTSEKGTFKNRFLIKFDNQTLSNDDAEYANSVVVFGREQLTVKSELFNIKNIVVYDLLGKTLLNVKDANTKEYSLLNLKNTNSALLVKTTLENGAVVTKKVIF
ncbi:MAG: GEVED domain-containing protein [Bacteroidota bacterium]